MSRIGYRAVYSSLTRAVPPIPIELAAARDRSMHRPRTKGPRSSMRTAIDRSLRTFKI